MSYARLVNPLRYSVPEVSGLALAALGPRRPKPAQPRALPPGRRGVGPWAYVLRTNKAEAAEVGNRQ